MDNKTIRHVNCSMLVKPDGICEQCKLYKKNSLLRQLNHLCSASSHVNYRFLTSIQKDEHLKALHSEFREKCRQLHSLEKKIQQLHEKEAVTLDDDSDCDMRALVEKYSSIVMSSQPENSNRSFQYLFWKQQLDAITKSDAQSIRWHPLIIKWCLYLHHRSNGAYGNQDFFLYHLAEHFVTIAILLQLNLDSALHMTSNFSILLQRPILKWQRT